MQLFLKTPPVEEPLSLAEVKTYLRITSDQEDRHIQELIASARAYVESVTGRALLKQKWLMQLKPPYPRVSPLIKWTGKDLEIMIPHPPLMEVESATAEEKKLPFKVRENKIFLSASFMEKDLSITYWAGYGTTHNSLPPDLKMAVLMATRAFYDHHKVDLSLLHTYKVHRLI